MIGLIRPTKHNWLNMANYLTHEKNLFLPLKYILIMTELIQKLAAEFETFKADAELQIEKSNKAAGTRARKLSLDLEKLLKEFRKLSLEESKK